MMAGCSCCPGMFTNLFGRSGEQDNKHTSSRQRQYETGGGSGMNQVQQYPPIHSDSVTCTAAVRPGLCLSGSKDQTMCLFDYDNGTLLQKWARHDKEVTKVIYGEVSDRFFSASRDKTVNMWMKGNPEPLVTFQGHDLVVTGVSLNGDNTQICTGSRDNTIRLWDTQSGHCIQHNTISRNLITHVKWAKSASIIAQSGEDKEVKLWDDRTLQVVKTFPKKQYIQTWCDISEDNMYCLTCSNGFGGSGCEATLWDIRTGSLLHEFKGHLETVCCAILLPQSLGGCKSLIATSSNDCSIRVWDRDTADCLLCESLPGSGPLTAIAAYEDGSVCVSSFNTGVYLLKLVMESDGKLTFQRQAQF